MVILSVFSRFSDSCDFDKFIVQVEILKSCFSPDCLMLQTSLLRSLLLHSVPVVE